ncbi:beta-1,4-glucuronyltransferase 1-like [Parasteatoda tepidariorum]|uniref:beta-1,4-glucuronyltransferase 1-like n=1 Tax=Parasteatoda tepidariorum TaxID=114398 RepID=UPI0039BC6F81
MTETHHLLPQLTLFSARKSSPLCAFASSILFIYICGIGFYMWSANFSCRLRNLGDMLPEALSVQSYEMEQRGRYTIIKNYLRAALQPDILNTMTFATAAIFPELNHLPEICSRWKGPMSVSVYAPGSDFKSALRKIINLRLANPCIHQNVSWHVYFDLDFNPSWGRLKSPEEEAELTTTTSTSYQVWLKGTFKSHGNLPFPANIGRNVAIQESKTDYVLVSDLHYYPSVDIIPRFIELLKFQKTSKKIVYVLPVFKMAGYGKPPETKSELVQMTAEGNIVLPSSTLDCSQCNIFPHARKWLEVRSPDHTLSVYYVSHEKDEFESWQPYYISRRDIPFFNEEEIKEGRHDRKLQLLELCLNHYEFHILDNAFLVQVQQEMETVKDTNILQNFILHNNAAREKKLEALLCRYGSDTGCAI